MSDEADSPSATGVVAGDPKGLRLHAGLLVEDPASIQQLWMLFFAPLVSRALFRLETWIPDRENIAHDLAMDTIEKMISQPARFDPSRGKSLSGYLKMDMEGDLLNRLERLKRQPRLLSIDQPIGGNDDDVGNATLGGNIASEEPTPDDILQARESLDRVLSIRDRVAFLAEERAVFDLQYREGIKHTSAFAAALNITDLPEKEQARQVQTIKDRLAKRLRRIDEGDV